MTDQTTSNSVFGFVIIVDGMQLRKHAFMEDARDNNSARFFTIKDHVLAAFLPEKSGSNVVALSAQMRFFSEQRAAVFEIVKVTDRLILAPRPERIHRNAEQIGLGQAREPERQANAVAPADSKPYGCVQ